MKRSRSRRGAGPPAGRPRSGPARAGRRPAADEPEAIGIDTGGTFTDFVAVRGGRLVALKLPSTPRAPERAVLAGLARLGAGRRTRVRHGSTVATNTLLERRGARVAFATTEGFEDLIEIGRQDRPDLYALEPRRPPPLVPAERRVGVRERLGPRGERWLPMSAAAAREAADRVRAARPEAVAVGLLHAYADPAHERRLGAALRRLGVPVTLSSALCPEVREVERFSTAVANAYLAPRAGRYLSALARRVPGGLEVVLSHGGTAPPRLAAAEPVRQLLSGPAAGLAAARAAARACGFRRALTLDVGGTSTDVAFLDGELPRRRAREVAGVPIQLPMLDVQTVGAGGGSIARIDAGGLLHVGPESAGALPGPACYGRGGPATLTDALVRLGRIAGERLAGGALPIDRAAARRALAALGAALGGLAPERAAEGVARVAEARMAAALRAVSVERGHDPRGAALVAYGGAGGLHAALLAESLDIATVVFPRHAGLLCAIGALAGGSRRERSRSVLLEAADRAAIAAALGELVEAVRGEFRSAERDALRIETWAEVRYRGQSHELSIPAAGGGDLAARFHRAHRRRFGFDDPGARVEIVTLEARASLAAPPLPRRGAWLGAAGPPPGAERSPSTVEAVHDGRRLSAALHDRAALAPGETLRGPAVVAEEGATLWVPPGWQAAVHASGAMVVRRDRAPRRRGAMVVRRDRAPRRRGAMVARRDRPPRRRGAMVVRRDRAPRRRGAMVVRR